MFFGSFSPLFRAILCATIPAFTLSDSMSLASAVRGLKDGIISWILQFSLRMAARATLRLRMPLTIVLLRLLRQRMTNVSLLMPSLNQSTASASESLLSLLLPSLLLLLLLLLLLFFFGQERFLCLLRLDELAKVALQSSH